MKDDRLQRVKRVFSEILESPPAERALLLDTACEGDEDLRAQIEALLDQHDEEGDVIQSAVGQAAAEALESGHGVGVGYTVGAWRLVEHVAHGGMGAIYLAERIHGQYEQQAAIKLINPGLLSNVSLQRFSDERQILARLQHSNIARLIDGGTTGDGVPWLAMEFIRGQRIDVFCKSHRLDLRARLGLFLKVCAAVQYAHGSLVVHRDIKPSNILVGEDGEPKLLDFGVAKLLDDQRNDMTVTVAGRRALTPRYASPEQLKGLPLTTSTDIYSLTVLLYELLVGMSPYNANTSDAVALHFDICEGEREAPSVAARRSGESTGMPMTDQRLSRELKGDLDNILLKGLRREPQRRYASVNELADDIRRYLDDQPVLARADTWSYRCTKFLKRRRRPVLVAAGMMLLISVLSILFVNRIIAERDAADAARVRAEEMSNFLQQLLSGADRFASSGEEITVRDILDSGAVRVRSELADQPVEQARMMQTIATTYHALSLYQPALELTEEALAIRQRELGPEHVETLQSMRARALLGYLSGGDVNASIRMLEETRDLQIATLGPDSHEVAATLRELGAAQRNVGSHRRALEEFRKAYDILTNLPPDHNDHRYEPDVLNQIGNSLESLGELDRARANYEQALDLLRQRGQVDDPLVGALQNNIGLVFRKEGRIDDALPYLQRAVEHTRRILGEQSEDYEVQLSSLGRTMAQLGRFDEANDYLERAVAVGETLYGTDHPYFAWDLVNLARLRQFEDKHTEAKRLLETAIGIYREAYGDYHPFLAAAEVGLSDTDIELGDPDAAATLVGGTIERMLEHPDYEKHVEALARGVYGRALGELGRDDEARRLLTGSVTSLRDLMGDEHQLTAQAASYLIEFLDARGEQAAADPYRDLMTPLAPVQGR